MLLWRAGAAGTPRGAAGRAILFLDSSASAQSGKLGAGLVEFRFGPPSAGPPVCACFLDGLGADVEDGTQLVSLPGSIGLDVFKRRRVLALTAGEFRFGSLSPAL
jgi:hypothetical protein